MYVYKTYLFQFKPKIVVFKLGMFFFLNRHDKHDVFAFLVLYRLLLLIINNKLEMDINIHTLS